MLDFVLNFLFPPVCVICGKIDKDWICTNCKKRIEKYEKFKDVNKEDINKIFSYLINDCREKIFFDEFFYCFEYKKIIRNLLLKYKFSDCAYLCNFFGNVILNNKKVSEIFENYDIMIPVPMDKIKKKQRGYNQTELITKITEKTMEKELVIDNNSLIKIKTTKTQSTLNAEERIVNVKNAFYVKNVEKIQGKKIIIFDDIITTGSTINEISRILKIAGAEKILVLVIAKD